MRKMTEPGRLVRRWMFDASIREGEAPDEPQSKSNRGKPRFGSFREEAQKAQNRKNPSQRGGLDPGLLSGLSSSRKLWLRLCRAGPFVPFCGKKIRRPDRSGADANLFDHGLHGFHGYFALVSFVSRSFKPRNTRNTRTKSSQFWLLSFACSAYFAVHLPEKLRTTMSKSFAFLL